MPLSITDKRLIEAFERIEASDIKLISIDVFDTLLARRLPSPPDLFLRMGVVMQEHKTLTNGQTPESFAALRYQTEYEARYKRQKAHGDREISLIEIYSLFPPHITSLSKNDLIALEIETETQTAFVNDDIVYLINYAKNKQLPFALITNMYMDEETLRALLRRHAPGLPEPDAFFVSCKERMGKRTGLLKAICTHFSLNPNQILHIGDNPVSDVLAAQEAGIPCVDYGQDQTLSTLINDEQPRLWHERASHYATTPSGDNGMTWLRHRLAFETNQTPHERYGATMMGPLLTGFAGWAAARAAQENAPALFGMLREGDLLSKLTNKHAPTLPCPTLAVSRLSAALACFTPDYPDFLEDFLTRRGFWTLAALMDQLGFNENQAATLGNPTATLDTFSPLDLTRKLMASPLADDLYARSAARRKALLRYLKQAGALDHQLLYLLDLGYAATIQRALQRVFTIENIDITTHGFYMVAAHVSRITQWEGGIVEGFLAQNGNPNDFACAFCRSPEIVELSCMPAIGTVIGYQDDGTPIFASDTTPQRQLDEVAQVQNGVMLFADRFIDLTKTTHASPDFTDESWRLMMRALAIRLVVRPTAQDAALMGHWLADSDMGLAAPRPIVSAGAYQNHLKAMKASELANLPRRDVPWLFGVAATLGYNLTRQTAQIIMRHEKPEAFD